MDSTEISKPEEQKKELSSKAFKIPNLLFYVSIPLIILLMLFREKANVIMIIFIILVILLLIMILNFIYFAIKMNMLKSRITKEKK